MNDSSPTLITYILRNGNDFYCGKTVDIERRMKEHENDNYKLFSLVWKIDEDYEKKIKTFGVRKFFKCCNKGLLS